MSIVCCMCEHSVAQLCPILCDPMAAAAAKSLQSCPTLCDSIDASPPGSPVPGILQARTLEWVAISFSNACKWKVRVKSLSRVRLFATPWTAAHQAFQSMGFPRQEYWSGVPFPPPGDLPKPGIKPSSLACPASAAGFFTTAPPGKPKYFSSVNIVSQIFFINEKHKILFFKVISQHEMYLFLNKNETYYFSARLRIWE